MAPRWRRVLGEKWVFSGVPLAWQQPGPVEDDRNRRAQTVFDHPVDQESLPIFRDVVRRLEKVASGALEDVHREERTGNTVLHLCAQGDWYRHQRVVESEVEELFAVTPPACSDSSACRDAYSGTRGVERCDVDLR